MGVQGGRFIPPPPAAAVDDDDDDDDDEDWGDDVSRILLRLLFKFLPVGRTTSLVLSVIYGLDSGCTFWFQLLINCEDLYSAGL